MSKKTAPIQKPIETFDFLSVNLPRHAEDNYYKTEMMNSDINKSLYYQRLKTKIEKGKKNNL
jgi:hypothetical protein